MNMNPFRSGDKVRLDPRAVKNQFRTNYDDYPWTVAKVKDDLVRVQRPNKKTTQSYWYGFLKFDSEESHTNREFTERQEIAIKEIVRATITEMRATS